MFHKITLADRDKMMKAQAEDNIELCDYAFANNYIWSSVYKLEVAEICGCIAVMYYEKGDNFYCFPYGRGDKKAAIEELMNICRKEGKHFNLSPISAKHRQFLIDNFPGQFEITPNRDYFDYIYNAEDLRELKGKKYQAKRNHIRRFMDNEDWSYEDITGANVNECKAFENEWLMQEAYKDGVRQEKSAVMEALDNFDALKLKGGLLRKAGKVVAFTIGEPLNKDTFVVHIEKARPDIQGAYPMINREFVRANSEGYQYINREEDTGAPGLRKAKLSYHPCRLERKYFAALSEFTYASEDDREDIIRLWQECFGDDREYIELFLNDRMKEDTILCIRDNGKVVSMISLLPCELKNNEEEEEAFYIYAVATAKSYRGRGYAGRLILHAYEKFGKPLVLKAAEESLKDYYKTMGFREAFSNKTMCVMRDKKEDFADLSEWEVADASAYKSVRDEHFRNGVAWDEEAVAYAIRENGWRGGETLIKDDEIIMYSPDSSGDIYISETTLNDEDFEKTAKALLHKYKKAEKVYYNMGEGMILGDYPEDTGYLGITLE